MTVSPPDLHKGSSRAYGATVTGVPTYAAERSRACGNLVGKPPATRTVGFLWGSGVLPGAASWLPAMLDQIHLIDLNPHIRTLAQTVKPATVRSLKAIHLGTALHFRAELTPVRHVRQAPAGLGRRSRPPG
jgi:hypothetical protein